MSNEEIKAYVDMIEKASIDDTLKFMEILFNAYNSDNFDIIMNKICDGLEENIRILKGLNVDSEQDELRNEIIDLSKKLFVCRNYLDEKFSETRDIKSNGNRIVFAKTSFEKPYFNVDLSDLPFEVYPEIKKTLEGIINGVNKSDSTQFRQITNNDFPQKIAEFKKNQVRIYTTKLKGDILCVFALAIKKANNPKSVKEFLNLRLSAASKQIDEFRKKMDDPEYLKMLLEDSQKILDDIMEVLESNNKSNEEFLFPSDEELYDLVPLKEKEVFSSFSVQREYVVVHDKKDNDLEEIPNTAKKVKKRTRGLGKKTIARNEIVNLLKGLSLEELLDIKAYIENLKKNKELIEAFNTMYDGFLNMSLDQIDDFENDIENFENDDVYMRK